MFKKFAKWLYKFFPHLTILLGIIGIGGLTLCLLILLIVAKISEEVLEREAFAFDKSLLLEIHAFANPYLDTIMLTITRLGNPSFVVTVIAVSLLILWWRRYYLETKILILASLGAFILNTGLKLFFTKPRPQLWTQLIPEKSFSFPSGHALGSLVLYGFSAYLLANHYPKLAPVIYSLATLLILSIGCSRLYLGVHWPTDIIAGYGVGFLWLMSCITLLKLQQFNQV